MMHPRIVAAHTERPYLIALTFADGSSNVVDVSPWIMAHRGVLGALRDPALFAQVQVDPDAGTIVWPNGADLDPDVLYEAAHGARTQSQGT
jgi:hypothetical protein